MIPSSQPILRLSLLIANLHGFGAREMFLSSVAALNRDAVADKQQIERALIRLQSLHLRLRKLQLHIVAKMTGARLYGQSSGRCLSTHVAEAA